MFGSFSHDFEGLPLQRLFRTHTERKLFLLTTPYLGQVPQASPKPMGSARHNFKTVSALSSASTNKPLSISGLHKSCSLYCSFLAYSLATSHHTAPGRRGPRWRIPHRKHTVFCYQKNGRWKMHKTTACNSRCTKPGGTTWKWYEVMG